MHYEEFTKECDKKIEEASIWSELRFYYSEETITWLKTKNIKISALKELAKICSGRKE